MALFSRRKQDTTSDGISQIEFQNNSGRRWPMMLAALAAAFLIALALFFLGRWAYRSVFNDDVPKPTPVQPAGTNLSPQPPATPKTPPPTSPSPTSNTGGNSQIPNSGPGDVLAIFIGSSLAAAGLHYIISVRRLNSSSSSS